jgi:hypothetical protein
MASILADPTEPDEEFWRALDEGRPERAVFSRFPGVDAREWRTIT